MFGKIKWMVILRTDKYIVLSCGYMQKSFNYKVIQNTYITVGMVVGQLFFVKSNSMGKKNPLP